MCELLGLTFGEASGPAPYFQAFCRHAEQNRDGWGLACYRDQAVAVFNEACRADESTLACFLSGYEPLKSSLYVAHIRAKSPGLPKSYANTHPLTREYRGQDICWAHNGTLDDARLGEAIKEGPFTAVGTTDSERAFCRFLNWMDSHNIAWEKYQRIEGHLRDLNQNYGKSGQPGKLNLLFSNGKYLYAYCDQDARFDGKHQGLHFRQRSDPSGYVDATKPLDEDAQSWMPCVPGKLYVVQADRMLYPEGEARTCAS